MLSILFKLNSFLENNSVESYTFFMKETLYFEKVNSEDKVFYYKPDDRYIDNIQITTEIFNTLRIIWIL